MHDISGLEKDILGQVNGFFDGPGEHIKVSDKVIRNIDRCFGARISYEVRCGACVGT